MYFYMTTVTQSDISPMLHNPKQLLQYIKQIFNQKKTVITLNDSKF